MSVSPLERFGASRGDSLAFGSFDTENKSNVGLGMLINPTAWLHNAEIKLRDIRVLPEEEFTANLRAVPR
jgi:hypothetical protein